MNYYKFEEITHRGDMSNYMLNRMGQLLNLGTGHKLRGTLDKGGYPTYMVTLDNGKRATLKAHRLVAEEFIPNPDDKPIVNHIDEDSTNSCVDNLEWVTYKENSNHATCQERKGRNREVPVNEYTMDGKYVRTWRSASCVGEFLSDFMYTVHAESSVAKCCQGKQVVSFGRVWRYYEGDTNDIVVVDNRRRKEERWYWGDLENAETIPEKYLYQPMETEAVMAYFMNLSKLTRAERRMLSEVFNKVR